VIDWTQASVIRCQVNSPEAPVQIWHPRVELTEREERLLKVIGRSRKLIAFLRTFRHVIFDEAFQSELWAMYRDSGQGADAYPPALLCMAQFLQCYFHASDAEVVRLSATDRCWRLVLDLPLDGDDPAFSQGAFQQGRERLIRHQLDRRLLERTIEVAKETKAFDFKKLQKLRVAVDSRPFEGAGRVEDTFNLLGHAGKKVAACAAKQLGSTVEEVCRQAGAPLLLGSSTKAALDIDWNSAEQKAEALNRLCLQLGRLAAWVERHLEVVEESPLSRYIEALTQVKAQDLEPAPGGKVQLRQGVAEDRRCSIEDAEMRHGRKSKTKRFNGFKQHVETDLDTELILAGAVTPANRPEEEATPLLQADLKAQGLAPDEVYVDRAYVNSSLVDEVEENGGKVLSKPWGGVNPKEGLFGKRDFEIDVANGTITCPGGQTEPFEPGEAVEFNPEVCGACPLRAQCTKAASGRGRTVTMGDNEKLQQRLRRLQQTRPGRAQLRERVPVEHRLAHLANRQGPKAKYFGVRKNTYDLRLHSAIQNLETIHRRIEERQRTAS
jgi:hypothetical protein